MKDWTNSQKLTLFASCCFILGEIATLMNYEWDYDFYNNYFDLAYWIYIIFTGLTWSKRWMWTFIGWSFFSAFISGLLGGLHHWTHPSHWWFKIDALASIALISVIIIGTCFWWILLNHPQWQKLYWWLFSEKNPAGLQYEHRNKKQQHVKKPQKNSSIEYQLQPYTEDGKQRIIKAAQEDGWELVEDASTDDNLHLFFRGTGDSSQNVVAKNW